MNWTYARSFASADAIIGSVLHAETPGVVISVDIGNSFFDLIARGAESWAGHRVIRSQSLYSCWSRRLALGSNRTLPDEIAEPVLFGRTDGRLQIEFENGAGGLPGGGEVETRTIDSWMTGRAPLRWMHLGDPELVQDQLAGASARIARDRPLVTLYPAHREKRELLQLLKRFEYQAFDLTGGEADSACVSAKNFGWIAVPREKANRVAETIAGSDFSADIDDRVLWDMEVDEVQAARLRRSWRLFGLPAAGPLPVSRTLRANEILSTSDCYPVEADGKHSWRWLGPRPQTRLLLPCPLPGSYRVRLAILSTYMKGQLQGCRVIAEGRQISTVTSQSVPGTIEFICHLDAADYKGYLEAWIICTGEYLRSESDSRTLWISVESIRISNYH